MTPTETLSAIRQLTREETGRDDDAACLQVAAALLADVLPELDHERRGGYHRHHGTAKVRG